MPSRWTSASGPRGREYDQRFERLAAAGHDVHGEASFVMAYQPGSVLDAGCGTGRVAIELARRGVTVVGVDLDRDMLQRACDKAPDIEWYHADLERLVLADADGGVRRFDLVVTAGNVMIFLDPGSEAQVVRRLARHVRPGGLLVSGFQLTRGQYGVDAYDADCRAAGLVSVSRYGSWSRDPWSNESGYAVSVHQRPVPEHGAGPTDEEAADREDSGPDQPSGDPGSDTDR